MKTSKNNLLFLFFNLCIFASHAEEERKPYIVYMGELPEDTKFLMDEHHRLLFETIGDELIAKNSKIHSYGRSFNGFVAKLLPHEAGLLTKKEGVVSVFQNKVQKLLTTRSWDFLGMPLTVRRKQETESDMIVALMDTGIWIESPSFNDKGFGPPPAKWKGKCVKAGNFTGCNNKVIGAQFFKLQNDGQEEEKSPADLDGHGTHTASTVAGNSVHGASLYGIAKGTARGGVPSARLAIYKVCWIMGCTDMDILAAYDAAIADGVDIISVSLGGYPRNLFEDPIAIGSFHAMKKGIFTSCAAGNDGPDLESIENVAPWILTVAATSIDRRFEAPVTLGNGETFTGIAINTFEPKERMYSLTNGAHAQNMSGDPFGNSSACDYGTLNQNKVKGKIMYCLGNGGQDSTICDLGGAGIIMSTEFVTDIAFPNLIPGTFVSVNDGEKIDKYINSTRSAQAVISKTITANMTAPFVASFSSRGPQTLCSNILKPDIAAPGLDILAAYSELTTMTGEPGDKRVVKYNIISGTSMACPHASGAAAYVKSFHPDWSVAAIKSALMTTAKCMKIKPVGAELASGSGQINPRVALHPGLVYDIQYEDYISFLCKQGYNSSAIAMLTGNKKYKCSSFPVGKGADGLNYPSIHVYLNNSKTSFSEVFYRTVTSVGIGKSVYRASIRSPKGLSVTVVPKIMTFDSPNQKRSFKVMVKGKFLRESSWVLSGRIVWSDSKHNVRSPILVFRS
ncbi:subtilisin-like protease SBT4.15 [Olea europaea var. sylvestris]|uniref:Subtilisin-like protease n=1 Tax=Olea europaea subsp. europaea TaxID=158383 RepID=A0A8S0TYW4_OLEEU|nr:subtilisin-like protease SBT4.15 [Olea europaea var. sylvestris]CAA3011298.1 subtilisin-like protease [Olea europaea subsp. europaea]